MPERLNPSGIVKSLSKAIQITALAVFGQLARRGEFPVVLQ